MKPIDLLITAILIFVTFAGLYFRWRRAMGHKSALTASLISGTFVYVCFILYFFFDIDVLSFQDEIRIKFCEKFYEICEKLNEPIR